MTELNFDSCVTNKDVCTIIENRVKEVPFEDLMVEVNKSFIYQEEAARAIYLGLRASMNVYLSGESGFGKSELIKFILEYFKIPVGVIVGYKDMPVDALLGVPDMEKLLKNSEYEIDFKKSVFGAPKVLVGEEFSEILPSSAAALKEILTEKGFRNKSGKVESMVSCMIVAANKNPKEMTGDESTKALYIERFPIKVVVGWPSYTSDDYMNLLTLKFPEANKEKLFFLSNLFEDNFVTKSNKITPRAAINIAGVYLKMGLEYLYSLDINLDSIDAVEQISKHEYTKKKTIGKLIKLDKYYEKASKGKVLDTELILYILWVLRSFRAGDSNLADIAASIKFYNLELSRALENPKAYVTEIKGLLS